MTMCRVNILRNIHMTMGRNTVRNIRIPRWNTAMGTSMKVLVHAGMSTHIIMNRHMITAMETPVDAGTNTTTTTPADAGMSTLTRGIRTVGRKVLMLNRSRRNCM